MPPVFDRLQYAKTEGEGLGNFIMWSAAWLSNVVMPPLDSQMIYKTNLAFCASYKDGTSTSMQRAMPSVWNIPRLKATTLKGYTEWQVWKYPAAMQSSREVRKWHYLELHCLYHSHPSVVKLQTRLCLTGRTYLSSGTCLDSLPSL